MIELASSERFAFAGDWHGSSNYVGNYLAPILRAQGVKAVVHTGDFGYWPRKNYMDDYFQTPIVRAIEEKLKGIDVYFVDGNHENHVALNALEVGEDGTRQVGENVFHLPRGFRWEWDGYRFMGLGGAASVDKDVRTPYVDWFPEEELTATDVYRALDGGDVDVMVTHDTVVFDDGYRVPNIPPDGYWPAEAMVRSRNHQLILTEVVESLMPSLLVHGHFHSRYRATREMSYGPLEILGLHCDGTSFEKNIQVVTIDTLRKRARKLAENA